MGLHPTYPVDHTPEDNSTESSEGSTYQRTVGATITSQVGVSLYVSHVGHLTSSIMSFQHLSNLCSVQLPLLILFSAPLLHQGEWMAMAMKCELGVHGCAWVCVINGK